MKIKKVALLAASAILLAGGISTAFAMNYTKAEKTASVTDDAVILNWGENQIAAITALTKDAYVYRLVVVADPSATHTAGATGNIKLTFTLAPGSSMSLGDCQVAVYQGETIAAVEAANMENNHKKATRGKEPTKMVTQSQAENISLSMSTTTAAVSFVLEFDLQTEYTGTAKFGGSLTVAMDYESAAA